MPVNIQGVYDEWLRHLNQIPAVNWLYHKKIDIQNPVIYDQNPVRELFIIDDVFAVDPVVDPHEVENYVKELQEKYPSLLLAGSRWFNKRAKEEGEFDNYIEIKEDTDYDLFVEDSLNARAFLNHEGFEPFEEPVYLNGYTTAIWKHFGWPEIQITTRKHAKAYKWAIDNMPLVVYREYGWKSGPNKPSKDEIKELFNNWTREGIRKVG